jgi:hypothetical protein
LKTTFSHADLARCAKREVRQRRYVYPGRVAAGRLKQDAADREIAMMQAIQAHFESLAAADAVKSDLFGGAAR